MENENVKNEKMTAELPYSYHTFMYPFTYTVDRNRSNDGENIDTGSENSDDRGSTRKILESSGWKKEEFYNLEAEDYANQFEEQYNIYQYLFPIARSNVLNLKKSDNDGSANEIECMNEQFIYRLDKSQKNEFCIDIRDDEKSDSTLTKAGKKNQTIRLSVNQIRLSIFYKLNIGILSLETEYYPDEGKDASESETCSNPEYKTPFDKACMINDYGRRLFSPVRDIKKADFLPEKITLSVHEIGKTTDDNGNDKAIFIKTDFLSKEDLPDISKVDTASSPKLINALLNGTCNDDTQAGERNELLKVDSVLDDRMFVSYLIRDDKMSEVFSSVMKTVNTSKCELSDAEKLYRFTFCDAKEPSCQNDEMLLEKLRIHIYTRWLKYGTLHTVTEYSFGCITGENESVEKSVILPFLTLYVEMTKMALVQRAAIVELETEAEDISKFFIFDSGAQTEADEENKEKEANDIVEKIRKIWKKYVIFQNELYMPEVTFQEQGVEIYAMLKKFLKIKEQNAYLDDELNNLHDVAELENARIENNNAKKNQKIDEHMNRTINLLAVAATTLAIVSMAQDYLNDMQFPRLKSSAGDGSAVIAYIGGFFLLIVITLAGMWILHISLKNDESKSSGQVFRGKDKKKSKEKIPWRTYLGYGFYVGIVLIIVFLMFLFGK